MYAKVIVGLNQPEMDKLFDYRIPEGMTVEIGVRVIVPFGSRNKKAEGYVISLSEKTEVPADKIKELLEVLDEGRPTFTPALLDLAEWMKERYFCTLNQCLQAIMPPGIRTKSSWTVSRKSLDAETKLTPKETALLALFGERREIPLEEVQAEFGGDCLTFLRKGRGKGAACAEAGAAPQRIQKRKTALFSGQRPSPSGSGMEKGGEGEASGGAKAAAGVPCKRQRSNCRRAEGSPRHYGFSH